MTTKILKNGQEVTVDCTQGLGGKILMEKFHLKLKDII